MSDQQSGSEVLDTTQRYIQMTEDGVQ